MYGFVMNNLAFNLFGYEIFGDQDIDASYNRLFFKFVHPQFC
jgi:hypothetical protein